MAETLTWIEPDGTEHSLSDPPNFGVLVGPSGRFMPPVSFTEDVVPQAAGTRLRQVNVLSRDVDLPFFMQAESRIALRQLERRVLGWFDPQRGDGRLRCITDDSVQRDLICRYAGGLSLAENMDRSGETWQECVLTLRAFDPYWQDSAQTALRFATGAAVNLFPFFPLALSASSITSPISVDNVGDIDAWPVWNVRGPGTNLTLQNVTTGLSFTITGALITGQTWTIDTRPGIKTIKRETGASAYNLLTTPSTLWPLKRGVNAINVTLSGTTTESTVFLNYTQRYLGP